MLCCLAIFIEIMSVNAVSDQSRIELILYFLNRFFVIIISRIPASIFFSVNSTSLGRKIDQNENPSIEKKELKKIHYSIKIHFFVLYLKYEYLLNF